MKPQKIGVFVLLMACWPLIMKVGQFLYNSWLEYKLIRAGLESTTAESEVVKSVVNDENGQNAQS